MAASPASSSGVCQITIPLSAELVRLARSSRIIYTLCVRKAGVETRPAPNEALLTLAIYEVHTTLFRLKAHDMYHLRKRAWQLLTPYACPKGLVPMPKIDTCAESGFPGTSGCLGMPAVIAGISKLLRGDFASSPPECGGSFQNEIQEPLHMFCKYTSFPSRLLPLLTIPEDSRTATWPFEIFKASSGIPAGVAMPIHPAHPLLALHTYCEQR